MAEMPGRPAWQICRAELQGRAAAVSSSGVSVEDVLSQNLLGKLVMPDDEVIKGKYEHLSESIRKLLWEASLLDFWRG